MHNDLFFYESFFPARAPYDRPAYGIYFHIAADVTAHVHTTKQTHIHIRNTHTHARALDDRLNTTPTIYTNSFRPYPLACFLHNYTASNGDSRPAALACQTTQIAASQKVSCPVAAGSLQELLPSRACPIHLPKRRPTCLHPSTHIATKPTGPKPPPP